MSSDRLVQFWRRRSSSTVAQAPTEPGAAVVTSVAPDAPLVVGAPVVAELKKIEPELINLEGHPLKFYPGFEDFVTGWNAYAISPVRL